MAGRLPAKKRRYSEDDSSSSASFASPVSGEDDDDDDDDDLEDVWLGEGNGTIEMIVSNNSHEESSSTSSLLVLSPEFKTQPNTQPASKKRRKVSLSPAKEDTLAQHGSSRAVGSNQAPNETNNIQNHTVAPTVPPSIPMVPPPTAQTIPKNQSKGKNKSKTKSPMDDGGVMTAVGQESSLDLDIKGAEKIATIQACPPSNNPTTKAQTEKARRCDMATSTGFTDKPQHATDKDKEKAKAKDDTKNSKTTSNPSAPKAIVNNNGTGKSPLQEGSGSSQTNVRSDHEPTSAATEAAATTATTHFPTKNANKKTTKKKNKKRTFQDELLRHLFLSCRPYTIKELAKQMATDESSVQFCLLSLTDKQWVFKKEFASGKQQARTKELYWANQSCKAKELIDSLALVSPADAKAAQAERAQWHQQEADIRRELQQILLEPSTQELAQQLTDAERDLQEVQRRVAEAHSRIRSIQPTQGGTFSAKRKPNSNSSKDTNQRRIKMKINAMRDEWKKRKEKCMDFVEQLADGMEKKVKDVIKLLELETDEMEGVKIPPKQVLD